MINFIDEQRSKSFNYYHEDFDYLENLDSKKHKQMLKKVKNMEKIDSGFPIHLIQKNPTFENQFFSRRIRCKLFHESDTKISYLDEEEVKFISYNDFYRRLYLNFTNSIYLNEERNMYTHYSKFKYTEKLLKKEYCIDLLLLLYDIKSKKANEPSSWIRLCDKYFALLKDHIAQYKVLDKFAQKLEKDNINNDDRKDALEKIRQLQKGNLSIIDNNGILAIKKNVLKKIGFCVDDYPFEDDLRVVLNTIFGISNICRIKPDKADSIPIKEENIEDDDISFLELYGYESKLYLIKVLIELAEYK